MLDQVLSDAARLWPHKTALIAGAERLTYGELARDVAGLAASLRAGGLQRGDRVLLLEDNGVAFVQALFAIWRAGGVCLPLSTQIRPIRLAHIMSQIRPAVVVLPASAWPTLSQALPPDGAPPWLICTGEPPAPAPTPALDQRVTRFGDALRPPAGDPAPAPVGGIDQDLACILFTSGTTAEPKGVMLSHANMQAARASVQAYLDLRFDDTVLCALPLGFSYGLYQILLCCAVGATLVLQRQFVFPLETLQLLAQHQVTVLPLVPSMLMHLAGVADEARHGLNLDRVRLVTSASAALMPGHVAQVRTLFARATLLVMYGMTECKRISYLPAQELARRPGSVGRGMPGQEHWLIDAEGRRLPDGSTGELVVRGSHVMRGYWRRPEETARRLQPHPLNGDPVLHTGDLFRSDAEGYLYFLGRMDDVIKTRGEKVSPSEVENALCLLAGVAEAAVCGVPDALLGQAVRAYLVLRPGFAYSARAVIRHCLIHLENHMVPRQVVFTPALPRNGNGKVDRRALANAPDLQTATNDINRR